MHLLSGKALLRAFAAVLLTFTFAAPVLAAGAAIWPSSRVTQFELDGTPAVGWTAEFFNCETTTPQVVYSDGDLSTPLAQPIEADARGMFPSIFLSGDPGCYRVKVEDAAGETIYDDDNIAVFQTADFTPPEAGETSEELLFRTGMLEPFYGTTAPSGWVRCNARTIGNAASGASERANADTEDLFEHLWTVDDTLTVSTGRGGSAASDFAANKTITLPDCRERNLAGLATMGNSDAGLVADAYVDSGEDSSDLGATSGTDDVVLTGAQLAAHSHTASSNSTGSHVHSMARGTNASGDSSLVAAATTGTSALDTGSSGTHSHTITVDSSGSDAAHPNMSPTVFVTILIKL
jgi:microcystin-dependent protein